MSLRIKLPAKPSDPESQTSATQPQRRKSTKRRLTVDSDEEHTDHIPSSPPSSSHPQKPQPGQSRRRQTPADDADVAREYHEEEYVEVTETRVSTTSPNKKQPPHSGPPPQKKKRVVASDEDFDGDEPLGEVPRDMETDEDYEDDFGFEAKKSHHKGKGRLKATKGGAGNKSGKGKAKGEVNDTETKEDGSAASSTLKRPRANTKYSEDTNVDVVGDSPPSQQQQQPTTLVTSPTTKEPSPAPPPPKKRKLPTIKKNKVVGSGPATPTTSQANAPNKSAPHPPGKAGAESTSAGPLAHMVQRKAALQGNTDVDLRNANVYAELFKGGGAPRAGINRREKDEERRKELNKMRDDARVKRLADAQNAFDLQAQMEKIARFEEKLRHERSSALYPNFLAGKWREIVEKEKRRKEKEAASEAGTPGQEEGEV